jgi:hypothetical protein
LPLRLNLNALPGRCLLLGPQLLLSLGGSLLLSRELLLTDQLLLPERIRPHNRGSRDCRASHRGWTCYHRRTGHLRLGDGPPVDVATDGIDPAIGVPKPLQRHTSLFSKTPG